MLFIISSFVFNPQDLTTGDNHLIAHASYDPLTVIANISLGDKHPHCIAVNHATNRVYIGYGIGFWNGGIIVLNGETDQIIAEIPSTYNSSVYAIAVNPRTNYIYAATHKELIAIDGATNLQVANCTTRIRVSEPYALAVNPVTNLVYVGYYTDIQFTYDNVYVYDGETLGLVATVHLGAAKEYEDVGVAVNPNTNTVYATWSGNHTLYMIDGNTHLITKKWQFSSTRVWVNQYTNNVYCRDTTLNGETLEEVTPGLPPESDDIILNEITAIDSINNLLYTMDIWMNMLHRIHGSTHDIIDSVEIPSYPHTMEVVVNPYTSKLYIIDDEEDQVCVVSTGVPSQEPPVYPTQEPTDEEPTSEEPTTEEPTTEAPTDEEPTANGVSDSNFEIPFGVLIAVPIIAISCIVAFWIIRKRKQNKPKNSETRQKE